MLIFIKAGKPAFCYIPLKIIILIIEVIYMTKDISKIKKRTNKNGFEAVILFLRILNELAQSDGAYTLSTKSNAKAEVSDDSRRIITVKNYINSNFMYELKLQTLADMANMSQSAFSRFFKLHTGRTLSDYIMDIRLANATRMLIDTTESIANISFNCGYNNLSNFNRIFRRKLGCSPTEFRENYRKIKVII